MDVETFYDAIHEDEPLLVTRPNNRTYFSGLFSKQGAPPAGWLRWLAAGGAALCTVFDSWLAAAALLMPSTPRLTPPPRFGRIVQRSTRCCGGPGACSTSSTWM